MKNWIVSSLLLCCAQFLFGQGVFPEGIAYQVQVSNSDGGFLSDVTIGVRFNIRSSAIDGTVAWQEDHTVLLDEFGHFDLVIGEGVSTGGGTSPAFSGINWSASVYFLEMLIDEENSGSFVTSMTQQMMAVPYAFHAKTTDQEFALSQLTDVDTTGIEIGDILVWDGTNWVAEGARIDSVAYAAHSVYADTATYALNCLPSEFVDSAGYAYYADTSAYALNGLNAAYSDSALYSDTAVVAGYAINNWGIEGNDNVNDVDHFLGTIDSTDLVFKAFNEERMRIKANGRIGIGTADPLVDFQVDNPNGVLFTGTHGVGVIPVEGAGTRMMWYPKKAAFRVGEVTGAHWNDAFIGDHSFASGYNSRAVGDYSVAFGFSSTASGEGSMAVGHISLALGDYSFAAGHNPTASGPNSVAIGRGASATAPSAIAIGYHPTASAPHSLSLGNYTSTQAENAVAIGYHARALHEGSFIYNDYDDPLGFVETTTANQFMVKAAGGTVFYSSGDLSTGVQLLPGAGAWSILSDSTKKENIVPIDGNLYLDRLNDIAVYSWNYKAQDDSIRHIGPMAQDFYTAFEIGTDSTIINSGDFDGINLLLVKALNEKVKLLEIQAAELDQINTELSNLKAQRLKLAEMLVNLEKEIAAKNDASASNN